MKCHKSNVKVKLTLDQPMKSQRWSRGIVLLFNLGGRWGWVSVPCQVRFTSRKEIQYTLYRRMGVEKLALTGI
jgi:hypothetical protein